MKPADRGMDHREDGEGGVEGGGGGGGGGGGLMEEGILGEKRWKQRTIR